MKKYIEIKIRKKYLLIFLIAFAFICSVGGYYIWCSYHPEINIQVSDGSTGKDGIKIEAPNIALAGRGIAEPAASTKLNVNNIIMQHEFLCEYVKSTYKTADIKLDIDLHDGQINLKYYGSAVNLNNETIDFKKEINCDFALDVNIEHK